MEGKYELRSMWLKDSFVLNLNFVLKLFLDGVIYLDGLRTELWQFVRFHSC